MRPLRLGSRLLVASAGIGIALAAFAPPAVRLKEDRAGVLRAVWLERDGPRSALLLGRAVAGSLRREAVIVSTEATPGSPDLDFDPMNGAWIAWLEGASGGPRVMVREQASGRTWRVSPPSLVSASRVRIVADAPSRAWAFWTGRDDGRDETFFSRFDGAVWSSPARLRAPGPYPRILMDAASGPDGRPWIVWSEYDGEDYEVFVSRREGAGWSMAEALTDDPGSDSWPSLAFLENGRSVVVWSHAGGRGSSLRARTFAGGAWGPAHELLASAGEISGTRIAARGAGLAVSWSAGGQARTLVLSEDRLRSRRVPLEEEDRERRERGRDENGYIAFGDETTFGWIDSGPAAELGYVPRLEALLTERYGPSTVANEGVPGETTVNGLGRMGDVLAREPGRYLLLMEGANDVVMPEISLDASTFNLEQMVRKCLEAGVLPLLSSLTPRNDAHWADPVFRERIDGFNDEVARIALNLRLPFVDMFNTFLDHPQADGGWTALLSDPAHPNERGYAIIAGAWASAVGAIPFPPEAVTVRRSTERALLSERRVNYLTWRHSSKIRNPFLYRSYRIYRSDLSDAGDGFALIAVLPYSPFHDPQRFNDLDIVASRRYRYAVSLVDLDGIEGPLSDPADDSEL